MASVEGTVIQVGKLRITIKPMTAEQVYDFVNDNVNAAATLEEDAERYLHLASQADALIQVLIGDDSWLGTRTPAAKQALDTLWETWTERGNHLTLQATTIYNTLADLDAILDTSYADLTLDQLLPHEPVS